MLLYDKENIFDDKFFRINRQYVRFIRQRNRKMGIGYLPLTITIEENGETRFMQDKFQTYDEYVNFFEMLKNPALNIFTSKNNTEIHREYFEKLAEAGHRNIIHFTISYQLANTRDNTVQAAEMVKEKYPDFNLVPIESHTTTVCQGMLVKMAVKLRDEGKTLQEAVDFVEDKNTKFSISSLWTICIT